MPQSAKPSAMFRLVCAARPEAALTAPTGDRHGRVDLRFDGDARQFALLAELKPHSGYGDDQVQQYRDALAEPTRGPELSGSRGHAQRSRCWRTGSGIKKWLGSLRWTAIYGELRDLPIQDPDLQSPREASAPGRSARVRGEGIAGGRQRLGKRRPAGDDVMAERLCERVVTRQRRLHQIKLGTDETDHGGQLLTRPAPRTGVSAMVQHASPNGR
jgi:hypothetical protein